MRSNQVGRLELRKFHMYVLTLIFLRFCMLYCFVGPDFGRNFS